MSLQYFFGTLRRGANLRFIRKQVVYCKGKNLTRSSIYLYLSLLLILSILSTLNRVRCLLKEIK